MKKRRNNLKAFFDKMTTEEAHAWRVQAAAKAVAGRKVLKAKREELKKKAEDFLPQLIAEEILMSERQDYQPRQSTINKLKDLLSDGRLQIDTVRKKYFKEMNDEAWSKLMRFVFKSQISQPEDLGNEILQAKKLHLRTLEKHVNILQKEMRIYKREHPKSKLSPIGILSRLMEAEKELATANRDYAKDLVEVGAVLIGKDKTPSLHIHMPSTPRPPEREIIDVTRGSGQAVSLDDLLKR